MARIFNLLRKLLPGRYKDLLMRFFDSLTSKPFKPYLKKKNIEGISFDFWIGDKEGREWYDLQCTDPEWVEMRFIKDKIIEKGDVVMECGGHHGCTAILLANWVGPSGKVITFEPSPKNCEIIEKNIQQNGLANILLERKAVGNRLGKITISNASNSSVNFSGGGTEVELTCLDSYEFLNPTFLKIDVEGFEMQVLQGAKNILKNRPKIAIEIHTEQLVNYGATVKELLRLIDLARYKTWIQWNDGQEPVEFDQQIPIDRRVHIFALPVN